jgi:malate dehydrogenase (oxaloacetate-decarboxylating)(NADP+)
MQVPVFHDDQHGTAIISGAALLNALDVVGKAIDEVRVVFSGAGAAALATATHYVRLGVRREHITMCDVHGVVYEGRELGMNPYMARFAQDTPARTVAEALVGGRRVRRALVAGAITPRCSRDGARPGGVRARQPGARGAPDEVRAVRPDAVVATGRSDYPNQVNNVLGFPFIFRGALDARRRR